MNILVDSTWINPAREKFKLVYSFSYVQSKHLMGIPSFGTDLASVATFYSDQVFLIINFMPLH